MILQYFGWEQGLDNETKITEQMFESKNREYDNFKFAGMEIETLDTQASTIHQKTFCGGDYIATIDFKISRIPIKTSRTGMAGPHTTRFSMCC